MATHKIPDGVRAGHLHPDAVNNLTAAGFAVHARLGQLVDVEGPNRERYLLAETARHWTLHLRTDPHASGHARNATHPKVAHRISKKRRRDG